MCVGGGGFTCGPITSSEGNTKFKGSMNKL